MMKQQGENAQDGTYTLITVLQENGSQAGCQQAVLKSDHVTGF